MNRLFLLGIVLIGMLTSCASTKNDTTISPYSTASMPIGQSALVYGLPQTRLFFEVEITKTTIKKGPYAAFANRMLGVPNVPTVDSESWLLKSIRISDRQEVDSRQFYSVTFTDYPQNLDKMLRFTKAGLILDLNVGNILIGRYQGQGNDDLQLSNAMARNISVEKVDTLYQSNNTDTSFVRIPVLQTRVMTKTTEELAREAADQIFNIRKWRVEVLRGDVEFVHDGISLKTVLQTLDKQEEQLLSLFVGVRVVDRQIHTFSILPEKPGATVDLFHFSERGGIVSRNAPGARAVWCEFGKVTVPVSVSPSITAKNIIYYRIPQVVEVSAGLERKAFVSEQVTVYQFGNLTSFPLAPTKK